MRTFVLMIHGFALNENNKVVEIDPPIEIEYEESLPEVVVCYIADRVVKVERITGCMNWVISVQVGPIEQLMMPVRGETLDPPPGMMRLRPLRPGDVLKIIMRHSIS